jgi:hypothetical protein
MTIREARPEDRRSLADLAALDSAAPITHAALVAELDGAPIAALDLAEGRAIADPMVPSAAAVHLLRTRAEQLVDRSRARARRRRHLPAAIAGLLR